MYQSCSEIEGRVNDSVWVNYVNISKADMTVTFCGLFCYKSRAGYAAIRGRFKCLIYPGFLQIPGC